MTAGVDGQVFRSRSRLVAYGNFVKVAHTVFALPFAVVGIVTAARSHELAWPDVALALVAFGAARFAAMGFNRIADRQYDALNPRTAGRELPAGRLTLAEAWGLVAAMSGLFVASAALLNPLCLALSPVALLWITSYSFSKRFTPLSHLWLGAGLAMAPVGGYLAVTGAWSSPWWLLVLLAAGVTTWVAGFDLLYSLQDEHFDREHGLTSLTVALGPVRALAVARAMHVLAVVALALFGRAASFGRYFAVAVVLAAALLVWEHRLVRPGDYSHLDAAFFAMNGIIAALIMAGAVADVVLR